MFLISNGLYLILYRTHVIIEIFRTERVLHIARTLFYMETVVFDKRFNSALFHETVVLLGSIP